MTIPTLITFIVSFVVLLGMGLYFCRPDDSIAGYLLGKQAAKGATAQAVPGTAYERAAPDEGG